MNKSRLLIAGSTISLALLSAIPSHAQAAPASQPATASPQKDDAEDAEAPEDTESTATILVTGSRIAVPQAAAVAAAKK